MFQDFVAHCLRKDPKDRSTSAELIKVLVSIAVGMDKHYCHHL